MWPLARCISSCIVRMPSSQLGVLQIKPRFISSSSPPFHPFPHRSNYPWESTQGVAPLLVPHFTTSAQVGHKEEPPYMAAQVLDQHMRQREAEKKGHTYHTMSQAPSKDPNAMKVDASCQKEECNRRTYMAFMKGECYRCGSTDHAKKDGQHNRDILYVATVRRWATVPLSASQNIWASRSRQKPLHR